MSSNFLTILLVFHWFLPSLHFLASIGKDETGQHIPKVASLRGIIIFLHLLLCFCSLSLHHLKGMLQTHTQFAAYWELHVLSCRSAPQTVIPHFFIYLCLIWERFVTTQSWLVTNACVLGSSSWSWDNLILHTRVIVAYWFYPKNCSLQVNKINCKSHNLDG